MDTVEDTERRTDVGLLLGFVCVVRERVRFVAVVFSYLSEDPE